MRITDTIGLVLKGKGENRVLSIAPEQSVYERCRRWRSTMWAPCW